jgi:hypothetical protein
VAQKISWVMLRLLISLVSFSFRLSKWVFVISLCYKRAKSMVVFNVVFYRFQSNFSLHSLPKLLCKNEETSPLWETRLGLRACVRARRAIRGVSEPNLTSSAECSLLPQVSAEIRMNKANWPITRERWRKSPFSQQNIVIMNGPEISGMALCLWLSFM